MALDPGGAFVGELLNDLEDLELPLLSWGVTSGALSEEEVLDTVGTALARRPNAPHGLTISQVVQGLINAGLLFPIPKSNPPTYRTRMAEALRLLAQLRQLFPTKDTNFAGDHWWRRYKPLVADYRLHVADRRYPKRNIPLASALAEFERAPGWDAIAHATIAAQVGDRRLARFQVEATSAVLTALRSQKHRGVVIGAGTGSGKTLAFYLPAFTAIRQWVVRGGRGVHTLALYPRTELLRDQLRDALRSSLQIEREGAPSILRPLRVGVLYGDTPQSVAQLEQHRDTWYKNWEKQRDGLICPFLSCPACERGKLKWTDRHRKREAELLVCIACGHTLEDGRLALTRKSLLANPPDLLFTTTEMLNRTSMDPGLGRLLGWTGRGPALVLLDEVHTYSGTHGAQTGLLLRRWRHAVGSAITFVGLSATLRDAGAFFAELVGLPIDRVTHIEPRSADMEEEGREYAIAVRSDPVSGASVLSTSIQTAMLFGRVLQADDRPNSPFGSTGFLFTDDLDVSNRFFDDLRDAEGGQRRSGAPGRKTILASLRASDYAQAETRYAEGQSWDLVERIGHVLGRDPGATRPLSIARTTSQDTGVDSRASLIVATAALEVGFNDPRVGLVLQHKAPHNAASFVQRRGRAGRRRGTRPITVVVLSEYGRDRLIYQAYDTLFDPVIEARGLPVTNRHVQKIQAAQSMFDWIARAYRERFPQSDLRRTLQAPRSRDADEANTTQWSWLVKRLTALLAEEGDQVALAQHLRKALQLDDDSVQALLWEQPRSLLLSVVPTVLRRLESKWQPMRADPGTAPGTFLPEFVTKALFEPLNLPEVALDLPFPTERDEYLPIGKALREAVPGRVSRRYGYQQDDHRTWVPLPPAGESTVDLDTMAPNAQVVGQWRPWTNPGESYCVLRPTMLKLSDPPAEIKDSSQGYPRWMSQVVVSPHGLLAADTPKSSPWGDRILSVGFATHAAGNPVRMRRWTPGAQCDVNTASGTERRNITYARDGVPAALGFELDVDGMCVEVAPLDTADPTVVDYLRSPHWRSLAFQRAVTENPELFEVTNHFQRTWLALAYFTTYSLVGIGSDATPQDLWNSLRDGSWRDDLPEVLAVLYRNDALTASGQPQVTDRLIDDLTELSRNPAVVNALNHAGELLFVEEVDVRTLHLARRAYLDTVASAILGAAFQACRDAAEQDLIVDVVSGLDENAGATTVWLTETGVGGVGVVERLAEFYAQDPARFWSLVSGALKPNESENADAALTRLVECVTADPGSAAAREVAGMRAAKSAHDSEKALHDLLDAWADLDGPVTRTSVAALSIRLLRPGSSSQTDRAAADLISAWSALEERLGVEIDARVLAYAVGSGRLKIGSGGTRLTADQVFSILWPRGAQVRNQHLTNYQPYVSYDTPVIHDRLLIAAAHDEHLPLIPLASPDWQQRYRSELPKAGAVWLSCPTDDRRTLGRAIAMIPALPVDADVLRVYGTITETVRHSREFRVRVELRESGR
ncbi:protein DpdJ [Saccharomonospora xinjiangensis]|uniref:protein DpdJ n=1 Tax=Saccharomonospora xinjiangensis TaxID=75294 RepID=UPI00106F6EBB|nr:protein DpdJ [Saccharomonospora xinjiangensis]QBQ61664.1 putative ATP-dependent helicase Lhr [Saccharomonospora xinjiangensis]